MTALESELVAIVGRDVFWIAFTQFLLIRPLLQVLPRVNVGSWFLNLAASAVLTMFLLTLLFVLPLLAFGYLPIPRVAAIRGAYFWGLIAGGLATNPFYFLLARIFNLSKSHGAE